MSTMDARGIPTPQCPSCASTLLKLTVKFDPETYEIDLYFLEDAECAVCGTLVTAPTPLDLPGAEDDYL